MHRDDLSGMSVAALRSLAAEHKIPGRSRLRKSELVEALAELQPRAPQPLPPPTTARAADASSSADTAAAAAPRSVPSDGPDPGLPIPDRYDRDRLVLMPQDPTHLFAYWELSGDSLARARERIDGEGHLVLVVVSPRGVEQREVDLLGGNYYLSVAPGTTYRGELALRGAHGELVTVVAAAPVATPPLGPSDRLDEAWMAVDETFEELLVGAGVPGQAPSSAEIAGKRVHARLWHEAVAGPGLPPGSSEHMPGLPSSYVLPSSHDLGGSGDLQR